MEFIIGSFFSYLFVELILTVPIVWFGRSRANWCMSDLIIGVLPYFIYIGVHTVTPAKGGGSNFILESTLMALIVPSAAGVHLLISSYCQRNVTSIMFHIVARVAFLCIAIVAAFGLRLFVPAMPD